MKKKYLCCKGESASSDKNFLEKQQSSKEYTSIRKSITFSDESESPPNQTEKIRRGSHSIQNAESGNIRLFETIAEDVPPPEENRRSLGDSCRQLSVVPPYPKSVGYIISNEFCERFNYYGLRTILVLYLTSKLHFDDDTSTILFHIFTMTVYLCPLLGAIIADSWLGKYKTILYLSFVYALGGIIVALGAIPQLGLPQVKATMLGLALIAIGTGGIKPCVSAFGGDQFKLPEQTKQLATFFSLFYFSINAGSMLSTSITPILREDVHCFAQNDCFSLAFGVPAMLMLLSVVIFLFGKNLYVVKPPAGNMIFGVSQCIVEAVRGWRSERNSLPKRKHWLDYAEPRVGAKLVADTKTLLKILILFLPFPVFWALFDQQGSRWTFQATRMDGEIFGINIKPDQMQVINPLLILTFIPLFDYVLYPILYMMGIRKPLQKLTTGGLLAAVAFLLSAFVELKLEAVDPEIPSEWTSQLRIYNGMPCTYRIDTDLPIQMKMQTPLTSLDLWEEKNIIAPQIISYKFTAISDDAQCPKILDELNIIPGMAMGYFISAHGLIEFEDHPEKPKLGNPLIRVLINMPSNLGAFSITDSAGVTTYLSERNVKQLTAVARGVVYLNFNGSPIYNITARAGGVYALIANGRKTKSVRSFVITEPNSVHIMWQLPQIIVITAAEIMFSITGLEFSFTQAPQSMKSVLQACWLLSVAIGNMLVVVIAELKFFKSQAAEFTLFAGLMLVDMLIFMLLTMFYKYVETPQVMEFCKKTESRDEPMPLTTSRMPPASFTNNNNNNNAIANNLNSISQADIFNPGFNRDVGNKRRDSEHSLGDRINEGYENNEQSAMVRQNTYRIANDGYNEMNFLRRINADNATLSIPTGRYRHSDNLSEGSTDSSNNKQRNTIRSKKTIRSSMP